MNGWMQAAVCWHSRDQCSCAAFGRTAVLNRLTDVPVCVPLCLHHQAWMDPGPPETLEPGARRERQECPTPSRGSLGWWGRRAFKDLKVGPRSAWAELYIGHKH